MRRRLEAFDPEHIYDKDESGPFYMAVPNRSFVPTKDRRRVRSSKAMKAKQRVTLVLAVNAAGTHMLSVALIGSAKQPLCFRSSPCPLPYFQQKKIAG